LNLRTLMPNITEDRESRTSNQLLVRDGLIASGNQVMKQGRTRDRLVVFPWNMGNATASNI
jgi:hypothetical protein